jgi:hypothetical protein
VSDTAVNAPKLETPIVYNMDSELLTCLKIISMIREGQKISVRDGVLQLDMSPPGVWTSIRRWLFNDSRHVTMIYIQNIILNALDRRVHPKHLEETLHGLNALKVTYTEDVAIVAKLTVLEEKVMDHIKMKPI